MEIKFHLLNMPFVAVHWDTKLLMGLTTDVKADRLPEIVSYEGRKQISCLIPLNQKLKLENIKLYETLNEWGITDKVVAMYLDNTVSNTGRINGACVLLDKLMERELTYLLCRHYILEIVLRSVFEC